MLLAGCCCCFVTFLTKLLSITVVLFNTPSTRSICFRCYFHQVLTFFVTVVCDGGVGGVDVVSFVVVSVALTLIRQHLSPMLIKSRHGKCRVAFFFTWSDGKKKQRMVIASLSVCRHDSRPFLRSVHVMMFEFQKQQTPCFLEEKHITAHKQSLNTPARLLSTFLGVPRVLRRLSGIAPPPALRFPSRQASRFRCQSSHATAKTCANLFARSSGSQPEVPPRYLLCT